MLRDGSVIEVLEAECAHIEAGQLICRDSKGYLIKSFCPLAVNAYGKHEVLARLAHGQALGGPDL
jgi:hypothetical protein